MLDVCAKCGHYQPDRSIDPSGPWAICRECGYRSPFRQLPLFIVAGASGAGKTTLCRRLARECEAVVALDMDILWRPEFDTPADNYREFFETWLNVAANIAQSGRPVALFGAGAGVPGNIEPCRRRRYFTAVHYLALVCDEGALAERLLRRPAWRQAQATGFIEGQQRFNQWFKTHSQATPPIVLVDTTYADEDAAASQVLAWINDKFLSDTLTRQA